MEHGSQDVVQKMPDCWQHSVAWSAVNNILQFD